MAKKEKVALVVEPTTLEIPALKELIATSAHALLVLRAQLKLAGGGSAPKAPAAAKATHVKFAESDQTKVTELSVRGFIYKKLKALATDESITITALQEACADFLGEAPVYPYLTKLASNGHCELTVGGVDASGTEQEAEGEGEEAEGEENQGE